MKKEIVFFLVFAAFGLAGCDGGVPTFGTNPYYGSTGLVMNFRENSPPAYVYAGKPFKVILDLQNDGAYNISEGRVYLTNLVPTYLTLTGDLTRQITLEGRSSYVIAGARNSLIWEMKANELANDQFDEPETTIGASAEYKYQTFAETSICIDPDMFQEKATQKACTMQKQISLQDQGAPVAVKSVQLDIINTDLQNGELILTIGVQNIGNGIVLAGWPSNYGKINALNAEVSLGGKPLVCDTTQIQLTEEKGELICKSKYSSPNEYTTILQIKLDYVYKQNIEPRKILIKKQPLP